MTFPTAAPWYELDEKKNAIPTDARRANDLLGDIDARRVAEDMAKGLRVSAVFLVLDHNWGSGDPLLFETQVFPAGSNRPCFAQDRYATWDEAVAGHAAILARVFVGEFDMALMAVEWSD